MSKTPRPVIERLQRETAAALAEPDLRERYAVLGIEPVGSTPEEFAAQIRADLARWEKWSSRRTLGRTDQQPRS